MPRGSWILIEPCFPCLSVTVPSPASLLILALCLGRSYDEKVDVFSFGIVLCEVSHIAALVPRPSGSSPLSPTLPCSSLDVHRVLRPLEHGSPKQSTASVGYSLVPGYSYLNCPQSIWQASRTPKLRGPTLTSGLCTEQIIGRVNADPDYLPRTMDFGLNVRGFLDRYCPPNCPPSFFPITVRCCDLDPEKR